MQYQAASFDEPGDAKRAWRTIQSSPATRNISVQNMVHDGLYVVVAFTEREAFDDATAGVISRALAPGKPYLFPERLLRTLEARRRANLAGAARRPDGSAHITKHGMDFFAVDEPPPGWGVLDVEKQMRAILVMYRKEGMPLLEAYARMHAEAHIKMAQHYPGSIQPEQVAYVDFLKRAIRQARRYIFTDAALRMHQAVMGTSQTPAEVGASSLWIELEQPQPVVYFPDFKLAAMHICYVTHEPDKARMIGFFAISDAGRTLCSGVCIPTQAHVAPPEGIAFDQFSPGNDFTCPYGDEHEETACARCRQDAMYWGRWCHTAVEMIQKKYAVDPGGVEFATRQVRVVEEEVRQRQHGHKTRKVRHERTIPFTVINYEVSVREPLPDEDGEVQTSGRGNWHRLHGSDEIIYVRRDISVRPRRFPRRRDGTRKDGEVTVRNHPRYVPMLRPGAARHAVVRRVQAVRYATPQETHHAPSSN